MCINLILIGAISCALFDIITFFRNIKDTITWNIERNPEKKYYEDIWIIIDFTQSFVIKVLSLNYIILFS